MVIRGDAGLLVVPMRWQLIPPWWKESLKDLPATFNARAETVADKPMFRDVFRRTRCLIPASGYYEHDWGCRIGSTNRPDTNPRAAVTAIPNNSFFND